METVAGCATLHYIVYQLNTMHKNLIKRDELREDIEQLCMQQAGPGMRWHYLFKLEIRMHCEFIPPIRTAGLEQEIESLKKKLTACTREKLNLQEELSEAYRIKGQLADLHAAEVSKGQRKASNRDIFQEYGSREAG
ncbi:hypothetical protein CsSME_00050940 [Camellia sinensis var. sinensis]